VTSLSLSPCTTLLATASITPGSTSSSPRPHALMVVVWDRLRAAPLAVLTSEAHGLACGVPPPAWAPTRPQGTPLSFSPEGNLLAVGGRDEKGRAAFAVVDVTALLAAARVGAPLRTGAGVTAVAPLPLPSRCTTGQERPPMLPMRRAGEALTSGASVLARAIVDGGGSRLVTLAFVPSGTHAPTLATLSDGSGGAEVGGLCLWTFAGGRAAGAAVGMGGTSRVGGVTYTGLAFAPAALAGGSTPARSGGGGRPSTPSSAHPLSASLSATSRATKAVATGLPGGTIRAGGTAPASAAAPLPPLPSALVSTTAGSVLVLDLATRSLASVHEGLHAGVVAAVAWGDGRAATVGGEDGALRLWSAAFSTAIVEAAHEGSGLAVALAPGGRLAAVSVAGTALCGYGVPPASVRGGLSCLSPRSSLGVMDGVSAAYSPVARGHVGCVTLLVPAQPPSASALALPSRSATAAALASSFASTRSVATAGEDGSVRVWASTEGDGIVQVAHFDADGLTPSALAFYPLLGHPARAAAVEGGECSWEEGISASSLLLVGFSDGSLRSLNSITGEECCLPSQGGAVRGLVVTRDGRRLFSFADDGSIACYSVVAPKKGGAPVHFTPAPSLHWASGGGRVSFAYEEEWGLFALASCTPALVILDVDGRVRAEGSAPPSSAGPACVTCIATLPAGVVDSSPLLVAGTWDGRVLLFAVQGGTASSLPLLLAVQAHAGPTAALAACSASCRIASAGGVGDGVVRVWDGRALAEHGRLESSLEGWGEEVRGRAADVESGRRASSGVWALLEECRSIVHTPLAVTVRTGGPGYAAAAFAAGGVLAAGGTGGGFARLVSP